MRIDIPQELPQRREPPAQTRVPASQESTPVQRHLHSVKERTAQSRPSQAPRRPTPSRSPQRERELASPSRRATDPREPVDGRRARRDRIPSQTIGTQLRPEERRVMLELGRFRIVRTRDLADAVYDGKQRKLDEDLRFLRSKGLVETRHINLRRDGTRRQIDRTEVATLTRDGRAWLRKSGEVPQDQTVYYGFVKPREMEHDSLIYRAYRDASQRIERDGGSNLRVKLDFEIKADVQKDIYTGAEGRPEARHGRRLRKKSPPSTHCRSSMAGIQIPDARIEFDRNGEDGRDQTGEPDQGSRSGGHEDIEVLTAAYRPGHLRAKAQAGFRAYASSADRASISAKIEDEHQMMRDIFDL